MIGTRDPATRFAGPRKSTLESRPLHSGWLAGWLRGSSTASCSNHWSSFQALHKNDNSWVGWTKKPVRYILPLIFKIKHPFIPFIISFLVFYLGPKKVYPDGSSSGNPNMPTFSLITLHHSANCSRWCKKFLCRFPFFLSFRINRNSYRNLKKGTQSRSSKWPNTREQHSRRDNILLHFHFVHLCSGHPWKQQAWSSHVDCWPSQVGGGSRSPPRRRPIHDRTIPTRLIL